MARLARGSVTIYDVSDGDDGAQGDFGARNAVRYLYRETTDDTVPAAPSATITWSTGALSGITTNWSETPPQVDATGVNRPWVSTVTFHQPSSASQATTTTASGSTPAKGFTFDGVVTFTTTGGTGTGSVRLTDGTTTKRVLESDDLGSSGTTVIDGGRITTNTLNADRITTDTLTLGQVTNQTETNQGSIEFTNNLITIKDGSGNVRVKLGKLN